MVRWRVVAAALCVALVLALGAPYVFFLVHWELPLILLSAGAAYLCRRRLTDALLYSATLFAAHAVEASVGPQLVAAISISLLAVTGKPRLSIGIAAGAVMLLVTAIRLKIQFAGTPLTWQDVRFFFAEFRDNMGVFTTQPTLLMYGFAAIAAVLAGCALLWRFDGPRLRPGQSPAWLVTAGMIALVLWSAFGVYEQARASSRRGVWRIAEGPQESVQLSTFLATAFLEPMVSFPDADTARFSKPDSVRGAASNTSKPDDIVVFLQESQFNPATIDGCPAALCQGAAFGAGSGTLAHGPMRVHVFGGGTWLTEFSLATGVPHKVFGPAADFAPFNVAPSVRQSFPRSLRAAGYRTVAVYPVNGGMMNARRAYQAYGFDRFLDAADLGFEGGFQLPDRQIHEAAMRVLAEERSFGKPVYLQVVTIFNHSEHGIHLERVPAELQSQAAKYFGDAREARSVADYLWRTREFEIAMGRTARQLTEMGRPTVLAWFGDHLPPFGNASSLKDRIRPYPTSGLEMPAKYQTWYHVERIPAPRSAAGRPAPAPLDIVFLPGLLAQSAGASLDDWMAANVLARQDCQGLFLECSESRSRDAYLAYLLRDLRAFALD